VGELWKLDDIESFSHYFNRVSVLPLTDSGTSPQAYAYPGNVTINPPIVKVFQHSVKHPAGVLRKAAANRNLLGLLEFARQMVSGRIDRARVCLGALATISRIQEALYRYESGSEDASHITLLFFWGLGAAYSIPFLRARYRRIIACFHAYD